ncbi:hypothetical protein [Algoriphagus sp. Y33]|uniref:hypothetical protein n=1 Tax=Algoriphagus sp. Y33 TaxID=2772483 RepID=UPI00177F7E1F|nr:hypothetical protein [Algoriphagus sp. Y33]
MKHLSLFTLLFMSFCFFACDKDNEELPNRLVGTWENRYFVDSVDYWVVNTLEFKNDSVYQFRTTVRDFETGPDLGYRSYYDDGYEWDGSTFIYSPDLTSWIDYREEDFYVPKEELVDGIVDYFRIPTATISFVDNRTKMIFQEDCPEEFLPCDVPFDAIEYLRAD